MVAYDVTSLTEAQFLSYHNQVGVKDPSGNTVFIDEDLAVLLPILWDLGFVTRFSCSGGIVQGANISEHVFEEGYIFFDEPDMAQSFLDIAIHTVAPSEVYLEPALNGMIVRFHADRVCSLVETFQAVTPHHPALTRLSKTSEKIMEGSTWQS